MRIGIVGTNFVSDMFMKGAEAVPEIQASAVISGHREHAEAFAGKYGIPHVYGNLEELLDSGEIDAVYLAVPNSLHKEMALQVLKRGIPLICEKPLVPTLTDARELYACAEAHHAYLHDAIVPLYTDHFQILKENLARVGKIRHVFFSFSKYSSRYDAYLAGKNPTTFRNDLCNGCWMDLGVYTIADLIGLFGKPESVYASSVMLESGVDGASAGILHYGTFDAVTMISKISTSYQNSEIQGEEGTLIIEKPSLISKVYFRGVHSDETELLTPDDANSFGDQLRDFVTNVKAGKSESSRVPHALSLAVIETLEQCRKQAGVYYPKEGKTE